MGVGKARFQQSATTHSGTGEKETLNINVVGKKIEFGLRPTYAYNSSFSPPAEIMIMVIVAGGNNYNYNFLIPNYNYEYLYYHYQKAISDIGTKILIFTRIFTTDMFINANLTIFGATATDFPPLSNPLGPRA